MSTTERSCRNCGHFANSPPAVESALPGLSILSSAYAAVRSDDGLCAVHDRYVAASSRCIAHVVSVGPVHGAATPSMA